MQNWRGQYGHGLFPVAPGRATAASATPVNSGRRIRDAGLALATALCLAACGSESDLQAPPPAPAPAVMDAGASAVGGASAASAASAAPKTAPVLDGVNQIRAAGARCGATDFGPALPLRADPEVEAAADGHTAWMQANRTMSHTGEAGSSVGARLADTGYAWSAVGENVATGQSTAEAVIAAWLASPGHCANLMNPAFVDIGFAFAPAAGGAATYATMVLARPR